MLAIRLKRVGRSGHAQFRVIVQEHRFSPKSGKVVETVGSYNPHTKIATLDKDAVKRHLDNGAQPSERVVKIFKKEKIDLPKWVVEPKQRKKEPKKKTEEAAEASTAAGKPAEEAKPEEKAEAPKDDKKSDEPAKEEAESEKSAENKADAKKDDKEEPKNSSTQ